MTRRIGVCSWSLQPDSAADLIGKLQAVGLDCVQLALDPLRTGAWPLDRSIGELRDAGIEIRSGMMAMRGEDYSTLASIEKTGGVRLDENWPENLAAARANARLAHTLGVSLVTFHAGFLPHDRRDKERTKLIDRLRQIADVFAAEGVRVGFETGQETAETLLDVLAELGREQAGVNFDPANMILYGMGEPVAALRALAPHVLQVHVKDARPSKKKGAWGEEVPAGTGGVDWKAFFETLRAAGNACDLMIERESGASRVHDIQRAHELVRKYVPAAGSNVR